LISTLKTSEGIISARTSVVVYEFLSFGDISTAFELLSHPDETARHNILCWLIRTMEESGPETFISMENSSNIPEDLRKEAIEKFQGHLRQKEIGECSLFGTRLYAYIPNLRDALKSC
jgi:hypothetical protein